MLLIINWQNNMLSETFSRKLRWGCYWVIRSKGMVRTRRYHSSEVWSLVPQKQDDQTAASLHGAFHWCKIQFFPNGLFSTNSVEEMMDGFYTDGFNRPKDLAGIHLSGV